MRHFLRIAVALFALTVAAPAAWAQTVDQIIAKNFESKGGLEKWKSIKTMKMTGVASAQGFELPMTIYSKRPNLGRQELQLTVPGGPTATIVNAFDGTTAWMINPMMGSDAPVAVTGAEAEMMKDQSDFDTALVDYKEKGHVVELVGTETVAGKKTHHLKVTRKGQAVQHYYLDVDTAVEVKVVTDGPTGPIESEMSDYQKVDGILVPFTIRAAQSGQIVEMKVTKIEFNVPIDDAIFKMK